jgi:hypothetical protein
MITSRSRRPVRVIAAAAALCLISACSPRFGLGAAGHPAAGGTSGTAAGARDTVPQPAVPWRPGLPQLGIDVYWVAAQADTAAVIRAKSRRLINYAIRLHANSISVTFPFFTYGLDSDAVYASRSQSPTPAHIGIFLAQAAQSHIRVTLRPILNENVLVAQNPVAWRGIIEPARTAAWFRSYTRLLLPYARAAAAGHAATFVIGTELQSLEHEPNWHAVTAAVRAVYPGQIEYDENYTDYAADDRELPSQTFGVDAYPRFELPDSAPVGQLARAWAGWLRSVRPAVRRHAILSEAGITAVAGAYSDPGDWLGTTSTPIDASVQTNWYAAVCRAVAAVHMGGVYWWEMSFDANPAAPGPFLSDRLTFVGRPAQQEISRCFARLGGS